MCAVRFCGLGLRSNLLHQPDKLRVDGLEALFSSVHPLQSLAPSEAAASKFIWKQLLNVRTASKNSFQVYPSSLHVHPEIENDADLVQPVLSTSRYSLICLNHLSSAQTQ